MKKHLLFFTIILFVGLACSKNEPQIDKPSNETVNQTLTIFTVNDIHGQLDNFEKIKHAIDAERDNSNVMVVCGGDIFSGNPAVDNHEDKGYPMIDVMNKLGFDVAVIGNHEFDYGYSFLKNRIEQSEFQWICANIDVEDTGVPQPSAYYTVEFDSFRVSLLGLIETNGMAGATIPSSHPWKVDSFTFSRPESVVNNYMNVKELENSDLYIALTHIGFNGYGGNLGDYQLAEQFPYFDLIIGGHSHERVFQTVNGIPIVQAGSYLSHLGKIKLEFCDGDVKSVDCELISLHNYSEYDSELKLIIEEYNNMPELEEVVGYSHNEHYKDQVGCFYTDALRGKMNVDVAFQNTGGVRATLNEGDITKREIYEISPFNNGTVIYSMTVSEIKNFLRESASGFYYSGVQISQEQENIVIKDKAGNVLADNIELSVGTNDYIPAVHENLFPDNSERQNLTAAETLIAYLKEINSDVNYVNCGNYFRYSF